MHDSSVPGGFRSGIAGGDLPVIVVLGDRREFAGEYGIVRGVREIVVSRHTYSIIAKECPDQRPGITDPLLKHQKRRGKFFPPQFRNRGMGQLFLHDHQQACVNIKV
jgi:hypothetical protein